jgi:uncharacterized membrane protein
MEEKKYAFGLDKKTACALTYVLGWVSGLVFLLVEKEDKEIRFNAMQSLVTFGAFHVIQMVLGRIPFVGWSLLPFLGILCFVTWIVCIVKVYQGEKIKLPIVGDFAEKQVK